MPSSRRAAVALARDPARPDFRLDPDIRPVRYDLRVAADLAGWEFQARERLRFRTPRALRELVLHGSGLTLREARLSDGTPVTWRSEAASETTVFTFGRRISAGMHTLVLEYDGVIREELNGFYRSTRGKERYALTQFEAVDARHALFCFDEPSFKAPLALTLEHPAGYAAIANGAVAATRLVGDARRETRFALTKPLPTYLYSWVIGPLVATPVKKTASGVPVRVWLPRGSTAQGLYARDAHVKSIDWLERYTGIKYPFPKLDAVGVPDFDAGAMENAACITYRMVSIACDPKTTSSLQLRWVFDTVAHECVHQWWGDLATMAWWDDLWLNEAFATFVASKIVDSYEPGWGVWRDYVANQEGAYALDALRSTHAVSMKVRTAAEAEERFDDITYEKGGAVLRMLEAFVGEDAFQDGVRRYLRAHRWANATADDFWAALEAGSGKGVARLARTWLTREGHPLVTLAARDASGRLFRSATRFTLTQRRFRADGKRERGAPWPVPVTLSYVCACGCGTFERKHLLRSRRETMLIAQAEPLAYPNAGAAGFFRTHLDDETFAQLTEVKVKRVRPSDPSIVSDLMMLSPIERLDLVHSTLATVRSGDAKPERIVRLLRALVGEDDRVVLASVLNTLLWLDREIVSERERPALAALARDLFGWHLRRLGWEPRLSDAKDDRETRADAIAALGLVARDPKVIARAVRTIRAVLGGRCTLDPDLEERFAEIAAAGDVGLGAAAAARLFEAYASRIATTKDPQEEERYLDALASFQRPELVRRVLDHVERDIRSGDRRLVWCRMLARPAARRITFARLTKKWDALIAPLGPTTAQRVSATLGESGGVSYADAVERALREHSGGSNRDTATRALEQLRLGRRMYARLRPRIRQALLAG